MSQSRQSLLLAVAAFAFGGATVGAVSAVAIAAQQDGRPTQARPQLTVPDPSFLQQLSFADLVEEVSPAVVSIRTKSRVEAKRGPRMALPPEFERMLPPGFLPDQGRGDRPETRQAFGEGSGFFIDDRGHIVTNDHVVEGADEVTVVLHNGKELAATIVGTDPSTDLAVLKVEPSADQRFVRFETDADVRVGDYVLAVGNPFGLGGSVTSGIVSAVGRENRISQTPYADFIQIDASINQGNSGGPTFDLRGNVIGVNTAIISPTGGNVGIGLAVPAGVAAGVVDSLIRQGEVIRGWLGVSITDVDDRLASALGVEAGAGALVQSVQPGSPAARASFAEGDVVLRFDNAVIDSAGALTRAVGQLPPGKTVKAVVLRGGVERTLNVTLARRDRAEARAATGVPGAGAAPTQPAEVEMDLGVTLSALTPALRGRLGLPEGTEGALVLNVDAASEAAEAGIREGMVITRADNLPVVGPSDVEKAVTAAKKRGKEAVLVRIQTAESGFFLALPVEASRG